MDKYTVNDSDKRTVNIDKATEGRKEQKNFVTYVEHMFFSPVFVR